MKKNAVFILTWCKDINALYGSTTTLKTIRVGYPNSDIFVFDNCSIEPARHEFKRLSDDIGATFIPMQNEVIHHDFIRWLIFTEHGDKQVVLVDPDLIFWESMENVTTDKLLSGRLIGAFNDTYTQTKTFARLHTSFLVIPNAKRLAERIGNLEARKFEANLLRPNMVQINNEWWRWDTTAALYASISDDCEIFNESTLNKYDHLFCGSHLSSILAQTEDEDLLSLMLVIHNTAKLGNFSSLKGIWRLQENWLRLRKIEVLK
jgi:hypothetical protein